MNPFKDKITRVTRLALVLLASFVLVSCGGGGGSSSSAPTSSVTAVVNQSGGVISLADGTSVTLVAGIVKDATQITVSTTPDPLTPLPSGTVAASPSVHIEISANALQSNIPLGAGITVEIPVGTATAAGVVITPGNVLDAFKTVSVRISRGAQVSYGYAKYGVMTAVNGTKKAAVWVGAEYLKLIYAAGDQLLRIDIGIFDTASCFQGQPFNTLYQVIPPMGGQALSPDIYSDPFSPNFPTIPSVDPNKTPLVLVHGIQAIDSCTSAYKTTWATFISNFYNTPALVNKYQLFTYAYDTSLAISDEISGNGSGRDFAKILLAVTGSKKAVVVAHSMGGLVSRSALIYDAASIENLITLGTPHHGTTLRNMDELLVKAGIRNIGSNPQIAATALFAEGAWFLLLDANGARQLDWDNFDNNVLSCSLSAGQTCNKFIKDLNSVDSNLARYFLFAGFIDDPLVKAFYSSVGFPDGAGDKVVPKASALFQDYAALNVPQYTEKPVFSGKTYTVPFSHMTIHSDPSWPLVYPQNPNSVFATIQNLLLLPAAPTDTTPPSIPTSLTATAFSSSQINLTWAASTDDMGVTGYKIYRGGSFIASQATLAYSDSGISPSTQYCYTVSAFDAAGNVSLPSSQQCATTQPPNTLSIIKIGNGTVTSSIAGINCGTDCMETYLREPLIIDFMSTWKRAYVNFFCSAQ